MERKEQKKSGLLNCALISRGTVKKKRMTKKKIAFTKALTVNVNMGRINQVANTHASSMMHFS
jgi:hypothetical protein